MPRRRTGRPTVSAVLRCTWDDGAMLGEVVLVSESAGVRQTIYERTCDAWCFSAHVHKGAERLVEDLLLPAALPFQQAFTED